MHCTKNGEKFQEKIKKIPSHLHLYVGTGMRAACRFCTGFKNQKNLWGYPSNLIFDPVFSLERMERDEDPSEVWDKTLADRFLVESLLLAFSEVSLIVVIGLKPLVLVDMDVVKVEQRCNY